MNLHTMNVISLVVGFPTCQHRKPDEEGGGKLHQQRRLAERLVRTISRFVIYLADAVATTIDRILIRLLLNGGAFAVAGSAFPYATERPVWKSVNIRSHWVISKRWHQFKKSFSIKRIMKATNDVLVSATYELQRLVSQSILGQDTLLLAAVEGGEVLDNQAFVIQKNDGQGMDCDDYANEEILSADAIEFTVPTEFELAWEYRILIQLPELSAADAVRLATILELAQHDEELATLLDKTDAELISQDQPLESASLEQNVRDNTMMDQDETLPPLTAKGVRIPHQSALE